MWLIVATVVVGSVALALAAWGVTSLVRAWRDPTRPFIEDDELRRFGEHVGTAALAVVGAWGVSRLGTVLLTDAGGTTTVLSGALAALGLPAAAAAMWWLLHEYLMEDHLERQAWPWPLHLALVVTAATAGTVGAGSAFLTGLFTGGEPLGDLVGVLAWGGLLASYVVLALRWAPRRHQLLPALGASMVTLLAAASGASGVLTDAATGLVALLTDISFAGWLDDLLAAASGLLVGGVAWIAAWRIARRLPRGVAMSGYLLIVGMTGGVVAIVVGTYTALREAGAWLLDGAPVSDPDSIAIVAGGLATAAVGAAMALHHGRVLGIATRQRRPALLRARDYLLSGIGLVGTTTGLVVLLAGGLAALTTGLGATVTPSTDALVAAGAVVLVAGALWQVQWSGIDDAADAAAADGRRAQSIDQERLAGAARPPVVVDRSAIRPDVPEQRSAIRRWYLVIVATVAAVAAIAAAWLTGFVLVRDLAGTEAALLDVVASVRWPIATLLVAAPVAITHGRLLLRDRATPVRTRDTRFPGRVLLVGPHDDDVAHELSMVIGAPVDLHARSDGLGRAWDVTALASSLHDRDGSDVLVMATETGVEIIPLVQR